MRSEEQLRQLLGQLIFFLQHRYDVYTYMYDTMYVRYSYELNIYEKYIYGEKKTLIILSSCFYTWYIWNNTVYSI